MALLEGHVILQVALVFALIWGLGFILKWTFSRGKDAPTWPSDTTTPGSLSPWPAASAKPWSPAEPPGVDVAGSGTGAITSAAPEPEDYGLLASVAAVNTAEEAARVRSLLTSAGIRATTTVGADGRHRVLVFRAELHRARRVAGGA